MVTRLITGTLVATCFMLAPTTAHTADGCVAETKPAPGWFDSQLTCHSSNVDTSDGNALTASNNAPYYTEYRWVSPCGNALEDIGSEAGPCPADMTRWCPDNATLALLQGFHDDSWYNLGHRCLLPGDAAPSPDTVTDEMVAREFARIPLPHLPVVTEPEGRTLVNLPTYLHVEAKPLRRTVVLLGQRVDLDITPARFRWVHGDGTESTTTDPGAPYPAGRITHRYQHAATAVQEQVEITWTARWRLAGGAWRPVIGTVSTTGTSTPLDVVEATPVLTGTRP